MILASFEVKSREHFSTFERWVRSRAWREAKRNDEGILSALSVKPANNKWFRKHLNGRKAGILAAEGPFLVHIWRLHCRSTPMCEVTGVRTTTTTTTTGMKASINGADKSCYAARGKGIPPFDFT